VPAIGRRPPKLGGLRMGSGGWEEVIHLRAR
jgi:hypothetical protein